MCACAYVYACVCVSLPVLSHRQAGVLQEDKPGEVLGDGQESEEEEEDQSRSASPGEGIDHSVYSDPGLCTVETGISVPLNAPKLLMLEVAERLLAETMLRSTRGASFPVFLMCFPSGHRNLVRVCVCLCVCVCV
jgi:hypothetical protein